MKLRRKITIAAQAVLMLLLLVNSSNTALAVKLNVPLPAEGGVARPVISPNDEWVVYLADAAVDEVWELYSVPILGGPSVKLNGQIAPGGSVDRNTTPLISADSARVVYRADLEQPTVYQLYSAPIDGGPAVKLNPIPGALDFDVGYFQITPDGQHVLFKVAYRDNNGLFLSADIFTTPIAGGLPIQLNENLSTGQRVEYARLSPNGARVVYVADQDTDDIYELYSVPVLGGPNTKLNPPLVSGGDVDSFEFVVTPDSSRVIYVADQDTDGVREVYSVPITGGTSTKLNAPLLSGGANINVFASVSPDSSRAVYLARQDSAGVREIYSVPVTGGASVRLNGPFDQDRGLRFSNSYYITRDGLGVFYLADQDINDKYEAYLASITGGLATKINAPIGASSYVFRVIQSKDGSRFVYHEAEDFVGSRLYSVSKDGGPAELLSAAGQNYDVGAFWRLSANNQYAVYYSNQDSISNMELFSVRLLGGPYTKISGPFNGDGDVFEVQISHDSSRVIYVADQDTEGMHELYSVPIMGEASDSFTSTEPVKPIPDVGMVSSSLIVPGGKTFSAIGDVNVTLDITHSYCADLDVFLVSPSGTTVELFTDVGEGGENFTNTTLDDQASQSIQSGSAPFSGSYRPEGSLSILNGESAVGTWTLEITDDTSVDTGTLNSWALTISGTIPAPPDADGDGVPDVSDSCPNTPTGCPVSGDGCPEDFDNDGISNCTDACPDTPSGTAVNASGCPIPTVCSDVCNPACPNYNPEARCDGAAKFLRFSTYEEVLPLDVEGLEGATVHSWQPLALRFNAGAEIDPATAWVTVQGDQGYAAIGGTWQAVDGENNRDGWMVFTPTAPYAPGERLVVSAGAMLVDGTEFGPVAFEFLAGAATDVASSDIVIGEETAPESLDVALAIPASPAYRVGPSGIFSEPVTVQIPIPAGYGEDSLELYYFSASERHRGWYAASQVIGFEVPGSRETVYINGAPFLQVTVNHSGVVQLGVPADVHVASLGGLPVHARGGAGTWLAFVLILGGLVLTLSKRTPRTEADASKAN